MGAGEDMAPVTRKTETYRKRRLTRPELDRAILVDYEGNKPAPRARAHPPPTLLGYLVDGSVAAGIIEPIFSTNCAAKYRAKHAVPEDHRSLVARLLHKAESENRVIVSWSEHDLAHMVRVVPELQTRLQDVYRNAIKTVRPYLKEQGIDLKRGDARLYHVCEILKIPIAEKYGEGLVGEGLSLVRRQLEQGKSYGELTPAAHRAWQGIVKHNRQDLLTMKSVLERVLGGMRQPA